MELPSELIKDFVDATNDAESPKESKNVYGVVKNVSTNDAEETAGTVYVQIDGSQILTPAVMAADARIGDRVLLLIENHKATIVSNTTSPPSGRTASELKEQVNQELEDERTEREKAIERLANQLGGGNGLYQTTVAAPDGGGDIYYLHDKSTLANSTLVIKLTAGGIGISQDGGVTFPQGFNFVTGEAIAEYLLADTAWLDSLFSKEITATNLHIAGNSTFGGAAGKAIISTDTLYYLATSEASGITIETDGWTATAQSVTSTKKYLWTYHKYTYADGSNSNSTPVITGVYGDTGETGATGASGNGISSIAYYYATTASQTVPDASAVTSAAIPTMSSNSKYLWQKEVITYTDGTDKISVLLIAVYGDTGAKGDTGVDGSDGVSVSRITPLYYCSNSASVPSKPTSTVTTNSVSTYNAWNKAVATYTSVYKYYYTCTEILYSDGSRTWSDVVADNGLTTANANASSALSAANGKNTIYRQSSTPTGSLKSGDMWLNTSNGGIYYYNGSSWVAHQVGTVSIADGIVTADAIIASGVFGKNITATNMTLSGSGGSVSFHSQGYFYINADTRIDGDLSMFLGDIVFTGNMGAKATFSLGDDNTLYLSDSDLEINGNNLVFAEDSTGIKANPASTSTASSTAWLLRGHVVSSAFCCNLGNTSDPTRLYGSTLYRSGGSTTISSDKRLKKDFTEFDDRYEDFFMKLKPQLYRFIDNQSNRLHSGFVAQEVAEALDEAQIDTQEFAAYNADGLDEEYLTEIGVDINSDEWADKKQLYLRYEEFIALNTHMIQKLMNRVDELETRLAAYEGK